jgi:aspartate/methionine/tyrosine aminotransferase
MYVWDGKVAICMITNGEYEIEEYYNDPTVYALYKNFLELLWTLAIEPYDLGNPLDSKLTKTEKKAYLANKSLINLTDGSPHGLNPDWIRDIQINKEQEKFYEIPPKELILSVGKYFTKKFKCDKFLIAPSATFSFVTAANALIKNLGEEIILVDPGFDTYPNIIKSFGGNVTYIHRKKNFHINVNEIEKKISKKTRAIVLCVPENPLGIIITEDELKQIADICKQKDITLVIDYCFHFITPYNIKVPILTDIYDTNNLSYIMIADTGKILGLNGSKIGISLFSANLEDDLLNKVSNYYFYLNQYDLSILNKILYNPAFAEYVSQFLAQIKTNYKYVVNNLDKRISVLSPDATSLCIFDITKLKMTDLHFVQEMQSHFNVALIPLSFFYSEGSNKPHHLVRMALARDPKVIVEGVKRINEYIATLS